MKTPEWNWPFRSSYFSKWTAGGDGYDIMKFSFSGVPELNYREQEICIDVPGFLTD